MDSGVGTPISWHYTQETDTRAESEILGDFGVGTPISWHYTQEVVTFVESRLLIDLWREHSHYYILALHAQDITKCTSDWWHAHAEGFW